MVGTWYLAVALLETSCDILWGQWPFTQCLNYSEVVCGGRGPWALASWRRNLKLGEFTSPTLFRFLKTNRSKISSFLLTNNNKKGSWKLFWVLWSIFSLLSALETVSLCNLRSPGTHSVDHAGFVLVEICLLLPPNHWYERCALPCHLFTNHSGLFSHIESHICHAWVLSITLVMHWGPEACDLKKRVYYVEKFRSI